MRNLTKLRIRRFAAGFTAEDVAKKLGVSKNAVTRQERVGILKVNQAKRYADVLECDPKELLD